MFNMFVFTVCMFSRVYAATATTLPNAGKFNFADAKRIATKRTWPGVDMEITVMTLNTFFIHLPRAPKIEQRAHMLSRWFRALKTTHVPDVVVLNEMWHGEFIKLVCNEDFVTDYILWGQGAQNVTLCADDSPFGSVTPVANDRVFPIPISSGVIMLAKKGVQLDWRPDWDYAYTASAGTDALAAKGAQLIRVTFPDNKGTYYVVGTHLQSGPMKRKVRDQQLKELRAFVEDKVPANETVIIAGDLNVESWEVSSMMQTLTRDAANTEPEGFTASGFWARNSPPLHATESKLNQFKYEGQLEKRLDYVIPVATDAHRHVTASTSRMEYQYVAVRYSACYAAETMRGKQYMSDLADHFAVVAHIRDEDHGADTWATTRETLDLANHPCSMETPSQEKTREDSLSVIIQVFLIFSMLHNALIIVCCICCCCISRKSKSMMLL